MPKKDRINYGLQQLGPLYMVK